MILKVGDVELEIAEEQFVCLENGASSHFCEWKYLDPKLKEKFKGLAGQLSAIMQEFMQSNDSARFTDLSEEYINQKPSCTPK